MYNFYAFLRKKFSEYSQSSGQQGTVVDDLAVKPTGLILGDFNNSLVSARRTNDIMQWESMTENELDAFGNKFFKGRVIGKKASGSVRIWFDYKINFEISVNFRAVSDTSLEYQAVQPGFVTKNSLRRADDGFGIYYIDIPIVAVSEGSSYNLDIGKITFLSNIEFSYKTATNIKKIQNGLNRETNEQYYKRLRYGINDGSMMNLRSMYSRIQEFFPSIMSVFVANPGSKYMSRDLVSGEDISNQSKVATYLGKTFQNNMVKHSAFYGSFPPEAWSVAADYKAGIPIPSSFDLPLTIEASDISQDDPAYHGYPLSQEADNSMYSGLFFNDYNGYMSTSTRNLFDIYEEQVGFNNIIIPNEDWMYGSHYRTKGEFGALASGVTPIQVINFNNNNIVLAGGCTEAISVSKDIKKRIGVKLTGSFKWPSMAERVTSLNSNMQIMIGGVNGINIDAFTGLGFGVRVRKEYDEIIDNYNTIIYIAHSERYGTAQVFAGDDDIINGHISVSSMGALAERQFRIEPDKEYEFEFIVYDDLRISLYLKKVEPNPDDIVGDVENYLHFNIPSGILHIFSQELLNPISDHYGTMMKVSLETPSINPDDAWTISDLNAFDIDGHKSNILFAINVKDMEDPLTIYMRAFGLGSINRVPRNGYIAYIWDKEAHSVASNTNSELTNGSWSILDGISNADGTKQMTTGLLSHDIKNAEQYVINSRFGKSIFILVTSSGWSKASIKYGGDTSDDVQSTLKIDYIKVVSRATQMYHANNKADLHVVTYQNSEQPEIVTSVIEKNSSDSFFEMNSDVCKMPVAEIVSVSAGGTNEQVQAISPTEYSIVLTDDEFYLSNQEKTRIVLSDTSINEISVQYRQYPLISSIQDFFDGTDFGKIFGDILVKHKGQVKISFSITYKGGLDVEQVISEIRKYFDENDGQVFSIREMVSYLYTNNIATSVNEPIIVSYEKYNDSLEIETGQFTDSITIKEIEFFRLNNLVVQKI